MSLPNPFKLEKLRIKVFNDEARTRPAGEPFEVMFNPESFTMRHANRLHHEKGINGGSRARFIYTESDRLTLRLLIDGTGVTDMGLTSFTPFATPSVRDQVRQFLELCFHIDSDLHEPKHLKIEWGKSELSDFNCRLLSVDIEYTAFDRSGAPLRAVLNTTFLSDRSTEETARQLNLSSPDVTHARIVRHGDTLPLLCQEIYGSSRYYLFVARANQLDHFRDLTPGQTILFPPLEG